MSFTDQQFAAVRQVCDAFGLDYNNTVSLLIEAGGPVTALVVERDDSGRKVLDDQRRPVLHEVVAARR